MRATIPSMRREARRRIKNSLLMYHLVLAIHGNLATVTASLASPERVYKTDTRA